MRIENGSNRKITTNFIQSLCVFVCVHNALEDIRKSFYRLNIVCEYTSIKSQCACVPSIRTCSSCFVCVCVFYFMMRTIDTTTASQTNNIFLMLFVALYARFENPKNKNEKAKSKLFHHFWWNVLIKTWWIYTSPCIDKIEVNGSIYVYLYISLSLSLSTINFIILFHDISMIIIIIIVAIHPKWTKFLMVLLPNFFSRYEYKSVHSVCMYTQRKIPK